MAPTPLDRHPSVGSNTRFGKAMCQCKRWLSRVECEALERSRGKTKPGVLLAHCLFGPQMATFAQNNVEIHSQRPNQTATGLAKVPSVGS